MKSRLLFLSAALLEFFLLMIVLAPKEARNQTGEGLSDSTQWRDDPTPQQERVIWRQIIWTRWKPRLVWALLIGNGAVMICYLFGFPRRQSRS